MKIRTIKIKSIDNDRIRNQVYEFRRAASTVYNYVTVNQTTGFPISRHVRWEKARDAVLAARPNMLLTIVDCTNTDQEPKR